MSKSIERVELYVFDDIDKQEINLQEIDGQVGSAEVSGSVVEHEETTSYGSHKVRTITTITLSDIRQENRFRYTTESSKPDGLGIILRKDENDFVLTSTNQNVTDLFQSITEEL